MGGRAVRIAESIYLSGSEGDWIVTFNDGRTSRVLGHFGAQEEAIARFGKDHGQPAIRVLVQGRDVSQTVAPLGENGHVVHPGSGDVVRRNYSDVLKTVRERDRRILVFRWGLGGEGEHTAAETASKFGLTRPRIYQIEKAANQKLQYSASSKDGLNREIPSAPGDPSKDRYLRALDAVSASERRIFLHRRGLPGGHGHTAEETVRWSGLTATRISQIVTKVDHKLHSAMASEENADTENTHAPDESSDDLYQRILGMLPDQERRILVYRRGLKGGRVHTTAETASHFGVTPARIDEINAEARRIRLDLVSTEADMNMESRRGDDFVGGSRTPASPRDDAAQSGVDIPDEELLALVRDLIKDDDNIKEKVRQYRTQQRNIQYVESIGASLLNVPELEALREEWPQYHRADRLFRFSVGVACYPALGPAYLPGSFRPHDGDAGDGP
jgi:DNA-directed RNA polymerase sigma subunit (sigma70/sigma32)